nr:MAG: non-structural protein 1 [Acheta domestica densovirus]WRO44381.1 MAG: non-structural protein 1 [Acheta domestica densovirus]WRO44386.1 MAG: non-structural protein 1 [Acheta domestica densovirus]WRO44391.1 MAG: non-structural protein 1 [Acheta domestica densovirus]WRO44396.1 MAG: non-structural protein 1 [Acheta domestica densovirus]
MITELNDGASTSTGQSGWSRGDVEGLYEDIMGPLRESTVDQSAMVGGHAGECYHFSGGSEHEPSLRLRTIKEKLPEDYIALADNVNEMVGHFIRGLRSKSFSSTRRYISDVVVTSSPEHGRRVLDFLNKCASTYPGRLLLWVNEGDHIHVVHDCPYSAGQCRCKFSKTEDFKKGLRKPLRKSKFITELDDTDWANVFLYFIVSKWKSERAVWIDGALRRLPDTGEGVRWTALCEQSRLLLEQQAARDGCDGIEEVTDLEGHQQRVLRGVYQPRRKRSKFQTFAEEAKVLFSKLNCIPVRDTRIIIDRKHPMYFELHDPKNEKLYTAAISLYVRDINEMSLNDFYLQTLENRCVYQAGNIDPFVFYHNMEDSVHFLNELILFQCNGSEEAVKELLMNIVAWFNRLGWYMPTINMNGEKEYQLNPKVNTVCIIGNHNCGKNYFWDAVCCLGLNVGFLGRVNNKTNKFALQDCVHKRIVIGNEISLEDGAKEDMKKLCEGCPFNVSVKHQADGIVARTPVCLISNNCIPIACDAHFVDVRMKVFYWRPCSYLAKSKKKPYPPAVFELMKMYGVDWNKVY